MAADHVKPFILFASIFTRAEQQTLEEIVLLKGVGEYEIQQDPCGAYIVLQPLEGDQTHLTVFETYDNADYLKEVHVKSEPYLKLASHAEKADTRSKPVEVNFYKPHLRAGWLWRKKESKVPLTEQFFWIARLKANPGKRDELLDIILKHTQNVERTEDETLSFLVVESTEDPDALVLFERYTSQKYFEETHFTSESMKEYREKMGPVLAERSSAGYKGVAGFLDKREGLIE